MTLTKPDQRWAWVVALSSFGEFCISGYLFNSIGLIQIILLETFHTTAFHTSWITAVFLSLACLSGPIVSIVITKFSCRVAMFTGSLMLASGMVSTAFVPDINWAFLTFGVLAGTGFGFCHNTALIVIAFNFVKNRNMACGFSASGGGIGQFILTPLYQIIYQTYNSTGFFLLLGGLALQNCIFGATFRDSELEAKTRIANKNRNKDHKKSITSYIEIMKSVPMTCICLSYFFANIALFLVYIHFPEYCAHTNSSKMEVSMFLSLAGISGCVVRILFGMANNSHNIDENIMLFGVFSVLGFVTIGFPIFSYSFYAKIIYGCIMGGYSGCCWTVLNTIVIQTLGHEKLARGFGYLMVYIGVGTFLGPPLAGFITSHGGTYMDSFITAGLLFIGGGICCLLSVTFREKPDEKALTMEDYEYTVKVGEKNRILNDETNAINVNEQKRMLNDETNAVKVNEKNRMLNDETNAVKVNEKNTMLNDETSTVKVNESNQEEYN